jgi:pyruvate carboxylase subunit A
MVTKRKIRKVLIANRGEIALRIIRTIKELGLESVVVYEKPDSESYFIRIADEAVLIGDGPRKDYLDIEKIIWAAQKTGADAIHPGYGFLSENPDFSQACEKAGVVFIGPPPKVIRNLGNKVIAREIMRRARIPFIPGSYDLAQGEDGIREALSFAKAHGYPIMVKASSGGGGRGIRKVSNEGELINQVRRARAEAKKAFDDDSVYVEKCIECPRHVEVQILADQHGNIIPLGTRDCSIQRRNQKLLEIAPAALPGEVHAAMCSAAVMAAREGKYISAGTVEFLVDAKTNEFWFMEMNTRLQVEHTVTEELVNVDIVREQIRIAEGRSLNISEDRTRLKGHAIQVRINAEDPYNNFFPEGGKVIQLYMPPGGQGIRLDGIVYQGYRIPMEYDSLMVKMIIRGFNWEQTVARLRRALDLFLITGPKTTIPFYRALCREKDFKKGLFDTSYVTTHPEIYEYPDPVPEVAKLEKFISEIRGTVFFPYIY